MTAQSFASPLLRSRHGDSRSRPEPTPDLTLGVFTYGAGWKVYSQCGSAAPYASRGEALAAAETRAFAAARAGRKVELFIEDEDGALGQACLDL